MRSEPSLLKGEGEAEIRLPLLGEGRRRLGSYPEMDRSTARSMTYRALSQGYIHPDQEVYAWIMGGEWLVEMREALELLEGKNFQEHLSSLEQVIHGAYKEHHQEMISEYARLFLASPLRAGISPYGSIYFAQRGLQPNIREIVHFYHEAGFALRESLRDHPDHIAHELEFMGMLAGKETSASAQEKIRLEEIQMHFLSRFIFPWVPLFCEKVIQETRSLFYRSLSSLTDEFILFDRNYLGVPEESDGLEAVRFDHRER